MTVYSFMRGHAKLCGIIYGKEQKNHFNCFANQVKSTNRINRVFSVSDVH